MTTQAQAPDEIYDTISGSSEDAEPYEAPTRASAQTPAAIQAAKCRFCDAQFDWPYQRGTHEKNEHFEQWTKAGGPGSRARNRAGASDAANGAVSSPETPATSTTATPARAPSQANQINEAELTPRTQKLASTLRDLVPEMSVAKRRQLLMSHENHPPRTVQQFQDLLSTYGCGAAQIRMATTAVYDDNEIAAMQGGQGGPVSGYTFDNQGRQVPIIVLGNQAGYPGAFGASQPIYFAPPAPPGKDDDERLRPRDVEYIVGKAVSDAVRQTTAVMNTQSKPNVRRYQQPVMDEAGQPMRTPEGHILYTTVEEPYESAPFDPVGMMAQFATVLATLGVVGQKPPEEKKLGDDPLLMLLLTKLLNKPEGPSGPSAEIVALRETILKSDADHRAQIQAIKSQYDLETTVRSTVEQVTAALKTQYDQRFAQLEDMRNRTGLTDRQFELAHEKDMTHENFTFVKSLVDRVSDDLRPVTTTVVQALNRASALGPPTNWAATAQSQGRAGSSTAQEIADAIDKWSKDPNA